MGVMRDFHCCLLQCHLLDLSYVGCPFMWEARGIKERLDRGLNNQEWQIRFPEATVLHLPALKSYHRPILLQVQRPNNTPQIARPFRFMVNWLADATFAGVVQRSWAEEVKWEQGVRNFHSQAAAWNRECCGNIFHQKRRIMARMEGIDKKLEEGQNRGLEKLRTKLWQEYQDILVHEDGFWYQRARQDLLKFGDRNTRYFHTSAVIRKRRNNIVMLEDDQGAQVVDPVATRSMTVNYFK